jgi:hypothetical protein
LPAYAEGVRAGETRRVRSRDRNATMLLITIILFSSLFSFLFLSSFLCSFLFLSSSLLFSCFFFFFLISCYLIIFSVLLPLFLSSSLLLLRCEAIILLSRILMIFDIVTSHFVMLPMPRSDYTYSPSHHSIFTHPSQQLSEIGRIKSAIRSKGSGKARSRSQPSQPKSR